MDGTLGLLQCSRAQPLRDPIVAPWTVDTAWKRDLSLRFPAGRAADLRCSLGREILVELSLGSSLDMGAWVMGIHLRTVSRA